MNKEGYHNLLSSY